MATTIIDSDRMYRHLGQSVRDYAIFLLDRDGVVLNWNEGAERMKGYAAGEIVGRNFASFFSEADRDENLPRRHLDLARRRGHHASEGWRYRRDGTAFWADVALDPIHDDDGAFLGFVKVTRDLTERREAARRLELQTLRDMPTGIANWAGVVARFEEHMRESAAGSSVAVHYMDLDRFKFVNDKLGHLAGNEVLREIARRLTEVVAAAGCVGRMGGDAFVALQFGPPDDAAVSKLSTAILDSLSRPVPIGSETVSIGASIGVAMLAPNGPDIDAVLRNAGLALRSAKRDGGNGTRLYDPAMREEAVARSLLELKLRYAVETRDFSLVYQPIVDGRDGRAIGFEALMRWTDQTGANVSPAVFIPIAEELGLINSLGEWALRTACAEASTWPAHLVLSVNLSAKQLKQKNLADVVAEALAESGLAASRLELEITETAVLDDLAAARATLRQLRALGVAVALDDFGTGFSSLSLVRELPLTRIKIDRSFVADIDGGAKSTAVVASVIALCRGYGLSTTAEGIETPMQRDRLLEVGCHDLQGYLFGKPAAAPNWGLASPLAAPMV